MTFTHSFNDTVNFYGFINMLDKIKETFEHYTNQFINYDEPAVCIMSKTALKKEFLEEDDIYFISLIDDSKEEIVECLSDIENPIIIWENLLPSTILIEHLLPIKEALNTIDDDDKEYYFEFLKKNDKEISKESVISYRDTFRGWYMDIGAYAEDYAYNITDIEGLPPFVRDSIDWDEAGDILLQKEVYTIEYGDGVLVFDYED